MRGVNTGDHACKNREYGCETRNSKPRRFCPRCTQEMHDIGRLINRLNNPPIEPYTPRVYTVAPTAGN